MLCVVLVLLRLEFSVWFTKDIGENSENSLEASTNMGMFHTTIESKIMASLYVVKIYGSNMSEINRGLYCSLQYWICVLSCWEWFNHTATYSKRHFCSALARSEHYSLFHLTSKSSKLVILPKLSSRIHL